MLHTTLRYFFLALTLLGLVSRARASHIRGGEITARQISGLTFEFILTIYRDSTSVIIDEFNELYPTRDFNAPTAPSRIQLPAPYIPGKATQVCIYRFIHTYSSPGTYICAYYKEFRNDGVVNMSGSGSTTFYVETLITIDPDIVPYNTPVLTHPAVDIGNVRQKYLHNPGAYDPDNDSLSYEIIPSRQYVKSVNQVLNVNDYRDPAVAAGGQDSAQSGPARLTVDPRTGTVTWDVPNMIGQYNYALKITEWRTLVDNRGRKRTIPIGFVVRDIQVIIKDINNERPYLIIPKDTCVVAGTVLQDTIFAIDRDRIGNRPRDIVRLSMFGGLSVINPAFLRASFRADSQQFSKAFGIFTLNVNCLHVAKEPYSVLFKAEDFPPSRDNLIDLQVWRIKVVGPAPNQLTATLQEPTKVRLNWAPYLCSNAVKMLIYRKIDSTQYVRDTCNPGMPPELGFTLIGEVPIGVNTYLDEGDNGKGLRKGYTYCYRIVAVFPEPRGGESLVSDEVCADILLDIPLIVENTVLSTGTTDGTIRTTWTIPPLVDTFGVEGYYELYRGQGLAPSSFERVHTTGSLSDTSFTDQNLNTADNAYSYKVRFWRGEKLRDSSEVASSVRLTATPLPRAIQLSWSYNVPWSNAQFTHYIYRKRGDGTLILLDSISGTGGEEKYLDDGESTGEKLSYDSVYCYVVQTQGSYGIRGIRSPLLNWSQEACAEPIDTVPPCPPVEILFSGNFNNDCFNCDSVRKYENLPITNVLSWRPITIDTCINDIFKYNIYYSRYEDEPLQFIGETLDTFFVHQNIPTTAGCYAVTALDEKGNESRIINRTCRDNCAVALLPNLITPNNDGRNDVFEPICYTRSLLKYANVRIYNRWGKEVHKSKGESAILWTPNTEGLNRKVAPGVYYYFVEFEFHRLRRKDERVTYKGWLDVKY
jgi:gliding motility-associated-like protein